MRSLRCTETHICTHTRVNKKALCKVSVHSLRCQSLLLCCAQSLNHVRLSVTPWTVAHQAPVSMEFSMQEYWIKFAFPPPGDLPDAGIKPTSPALASGFFTTAPPWRPTARGIIHQFINILMLPGIHKLKILSRHSNWRLAFLLSSPTPAKHKKHLTVMEGY